MSVASEFRDISEYRVAFSGSNETRPKSRPESRPWLEAHLDAHTAKSETYPGKEHAQSVLHWVESPTTLIAGGGSPRNRQSSDDEQTSPYLLGFRHSLSLDFSTLEGIDA
jgi:hypothetical protein